MTKKRESSSPRHVARTSPPRDASTRDYNSLGHYRDMEGSGGRGHRGGRRVLAVVLVVLVALVVVVGVSAFQVWRSATEVRAQVHEIADSADSLKAAVKTGDVATVKSVGLAIDQDAHAVREAVHGPAWDVLALVPYVGDDIRVAQSLGDTLVDLDENALMPLVENADALDLSQLFSAGAVNVEAVQALCDTYAQVAPTLKADLAAIAATPTGHIPQAEAIFAKARSKTEGMTEKLGKVDAILPYLPAMIGADGSTRTYVVIAQNNAELRATGGLPGAWVPLSVTGGVISLGDSQALQHFEIAYEWDDDEAAILGVSREATDAETATRTPDFERAATRVAQAWQAATGTAPDGVVAVDPVFLQSLLALAGGITTSDGTTLDGTNAAQVLESDVYWRYDTGDAQDAFFSEAAGAAFRQLMDHLGEVGMARLIDTVKDGAAAHRLQLWMADEGQQAAVELLGMAGQVSQDATKPVLGIYVNDNTWGKIDWYLASSTQVGDPTANADGSTSYPVTTTWTNTGTAEALEQAPVFVCGNNPLKQDKGQMLLYPVILGPAGGSVSGLSLSNGATFYEQGLYGLDSWTGLVRVDAGETVTASYTVTVSADATEPLEVRTTPLGQVPAEAEDGATEAAS